MNSAVLLVRVPRLCCQLRHLLSKRPAIPSTMARLLSPAAWADERRKTKISMKHMVAQAELKSLGATN
jgi:hypothetical protein